MEEKATEEMTAKAEKTSAKKKKSPVRTVFTVILCVVLAVVAAALGLVLYLGISMANADPTIDDIASLSAEAPVSGSDRFTVTDDGDIAVRIFKNDIWWYFGRMFGDDMENQIAEALSEYGLEYRGIGMNITEAEGISADISAAYKSIDIVISAPLDFSCDGETLTVKPVGVKAAGIELSSEFIEKISGFDIGSIQLKIVPETVFLEKIDKVSPANGCIVLSGKLSDAPFEGIKTLSSRYITRSLMFLNESFTAMPVLSRYDAEDEAWRQVLADEVKKDGSAFPRYAFELLSLMNAEYRDGLKLGDLNRGFAVRWLPELDKVQENAEYIEKRYAELSAKCDRTAELLAAAYENGRLTLGDAGFELSGQPFTISGLYDGNDDRYLDFINDSTSFLVVIDKKGVTDRYIPQASEALSEAYIAAAGLDGTKKYPVGIYYRDEETGRSFLVYRSTSHRLAMGNVIVTKDYNVRELTEDEVMALMAESLYPAVLS